MEFPRSRELLVQGSAQLRRWCYVDFAIFADDRFGCRVPLNHLKNFIARTSDPSEGPKFLLAMNTRHQVSTYCKSNRKQLTSRLTTKKPIGTQNISGWLTAISGSLIICNGQAKIKGFFSAAQLLSS